VTKSAVKKPAAKEAPVRRYPMPEDTLEVHLAELPQRVTEFTATVQARMAGLELSESAAKNAATSALFSAHRYLELMWQLVCSAGDKGSKRMHANRLTDLHDFLSRRHNDALHDDYTNEPVPAKAARKWKLLREAEVLMHATQAGMTVKAYLAMHMALRAAEDAKWAAHEAAQLAEKQTEEAATAKKVAAVEARRVARQKAKARAADTV